MKWSLFLDDERLPSIQQKPDDWVVAKTMDRAIELIQFLGTPWRMSLDHDLGPNIPTGFDFIKWLVEQDMNGVLTVTDIASFYVHSQNPIGAKNINEYFNNYIEQRD